MKRFSVKATFLFIFLLASTSIWPRSGCDEGSFPPSGYATQKEKQRVLHFGKTHYIDAGGHLSFANKERETLNVVFKGCDSEKDFFLSPEERYRENFRNNRSLKISFSETEWKPKEAPSRDSDKLMWGLRDKFNGGMISIGDTLFFGAALKIGSNFQTEPKSNSMIYQLWQGGGHSPPVSLHLHKQEGEPYLLIRRNYLDLKKKVKTEDSQQVSFSSNDWIEFIVEIKVSSKNTGYVKLWLKKDNSYQLVFNQKKIKTAYPENFVFENQEKANQKLKATFGYYRKRQNHKATIYFDDVRTAENFEWASEGFKQAIILQP